MDKSMKQLLLLLLIFINLSACNSGLMIWVQGGPSFSIQSQANLVAKDSYTLAWDSAGKAGAYEIKISKDQSCKDSSLFTMQGIKTTSVDLDFLAEGDYFLCVFAQFNGNLIPAKNNGIAVTIDRFAPVVTMPEDVQTVSSRFNPTFEINDISKVSIVWTQLSGDGIVSFDNPSSMTPGISANRTGLYKIKATATDQVGNSTSFTSQFFWDEAAAVPSDALLVRSGIATNGYINFADRLNSQPLWQLQNNGSLVAQYTVAIADPGFSVSCNSSQSYDQSNIPKAPDLTVDGTYILCAKLSSIGSAAVYIKSQSVVRDTLAPIVSSFISANEAIDGYINYVERNSSQGLADIIAAGASEITYSHALLDGSGTLLCNGATSYPNTTIPSISSVTVDGTYVLCARLSDVAGNTTFTKSSLMIRRTVLPVIHVDYTSSSALKPELNGSVSDPNATISLSINGTNYPAVNDHLGFWKLAAGTLSVLPDGNINAATFISSWTTNRAGVSSATQVQLPFDSTIPYEMEIDWGDGTKDVISLGTDPALLHSYSSAGNYSIKIRGFFGGFRFADGGDKLKLSSISAWGGFIVSNYNGVFHGAANLQISATDVPVISGATSLENFFNNCASITTIPNLSSWLVADVTNFKAMFAGATAFNQGLASWNMASATNLNRMFNNAAAFNQPLTAWNVGNVTDMESLFEGAAAFNQNISSWNTSKVTIMRGMFFNAVTFNQPLNTWDVSKVTSFASMFREAHVFNQPLSSWNTVAGIYFDSMFAWAWAFNRPISNFNVGSGVDFSFMFDGSSFNQNINNWNTANALSVGAMFRNSPFNQPLNNWNVSKVINFGAMFENSPFHQAIDGWDTSSAESMGYMFRSNWQFNYPIGSWNTSKVTNMKNMFEGANNFNQYIGGWDTSKVTTTEAMFKNAYNYNNANQNISAWDTSKVVSFLSMFWGATAFNQNISGWNTDSAENMVRMFSDTAFNHDLSNWNFSSVRDMSWLFASNNSMSQANYDLLLARWSSQPVQNNVTVDCSLLKYSASSQAAKDYLVFTKGWAIYDAGVGP
ncbi:MAG: BspA family leucine-rich repeat surface protein [Proteobacteria bacterium]|nr:MAG: BspA family leucine-rich repeat surface protein [Pseudomonadota bacterium]